jgi:hypothetical protein
VLNTWFNVPLYPRGNYFITVADSAADTFLVPTFTITPQISLSSASGGVGDQFTVSGNGFTSSTAITFYFDGAAQTPSTTVTSDIYGQFNNAVITVPQSANGAHTITAGDSGGVTPGVTYSVTPKMTLSTNTGVTGASITVSGTGFAANSALSFFLDATAISGVNASSGANGSFSNIAVNIPIASGGVHVLKAKDAAGNFVNANFTVTATMSISPTSGPVDTIIAISGKGFRASGNITVTFDGGIITTLSSLYSTADGTISSSFKAPASATGNHVITVSDGTTTLNANFSASSTAGIDVTSGTVGTTVNISGTGFKTKAAISITYNNAQIATTVAGTNGNFTAIVVIPSASTGAHSLVVTDQTNTYTYTFSVTPVASMVPQSPTVGNVGTLINISGTGFSASKTITVTYDSNAVTLTAPSSTDANGMFTASFSAPASIGGNHTVVVSDGTNSQTFTFVMESTAPPVPTLYIPPPGTKLANIPVLTWSDVTDPSGLTYTLQISQDATFSTIILEKKGLTTTAYTLTEKETLKSVGKNNPYYWRVRAIDGASNASSWAAPQTFLVGTVFADYYVYIVCGVIALMLGALGFVLGRITRTGGKAKTKPTAKSNSKSDIKAEAKPGNTQSVKPPEQK